MSVRMIAVSGIVFGILSFVLVVIDYFPVQVFCAAAAVGLSVYAMIRKSKLAIVGFLLGALFLGAVGLLWVIWPK